VGESGGPFSSYVPALPGLTPLAELTLDFSGQVLQAPALLSTKGTGVSEGDIALVARVERVAGVPYLAVVALAQLEGDRIVTLSATPESAQRLVARHSQVTTEEALGVLSTLPGVRAGGRYAFYRATQQLGFVAGVVRAGGVETASVVQLLNAGSWPFIGTPRADGRGYVVAAPVGSASLKATRLNSALAGTAQASVADLKHTRQDIDLVGAVTTATVSPTTGSLGIAITTNVTITASAPIAPSSVGAATVKLLECPALAAGAPPTSCAGSPVREVPVRFVSAGAAAFSRSSRRPSRSSSLRPTPTPRS